MALTTLVLGAGASRPYGYPLGSELRRQIFALPMQSIYGMPIPGRKGAYIERQKELENFRESFRLSQMPSIDAFLGRRPEFQEIGKRCISAVLLGCENPDRLYSESVEDHWYQYLWSRIAKKDWDDLSFDEIAIVTFNYDRSLEHFLYVTLQSAYGKTADEARTKLAELRIVHVYGVLSEDLLGTENYIRYDGHVSEGRVELAARNLIVIPEGRTDSNTLVKARGWLEQADKIGFLGFGYDETNVERLAEGGVCEQAIQRHDAIHLRTICGTRIRMFDAEIERAIRVLSPKGGITLASFHEKGCTDMLRITQIIG